MDFFFKKILKIYLFISLAVSGLSCSMGSFVWCMGFSSCGIGLVAHEVCGILASWPGIKRVSPALQARFLTTGLPERFRRWIYFKRQQDGTEYQWVVTRVLGYYGSYWKHEIWKMGSHTSHKHRYTIRMYTIKGSFLKTQNGYLGCKKVKIRRASKKSSIKLPCGRGFIFLAIFLSQVSFP